MFELFSDFYSARDNFLTRIDVRAKLFAALCIIIAIIISRNPFLPLAFFLMSLLLMVSTRIPVKTVIGWLAPPLGLACLVFLLQSFLAAPPSVNDVNLFGIGLKAEGMRRGFLTACRMAGAAGVFVLLSSATPAHRLFAGLQSAGVPRLWGEMAMHIYRNTFILLESVSEMHSARKARLGFSGSLRALENGGELAGSVIIRAAEKAACMQDAMRSRGYNGTMPYAPLPPMAPADYLISAAAIAAVALSLFLKGGA